METKADAAKRDETMLVDRRVRWLRARKYIEEEFQFTLMRMYINGRIQKNTCNVSHRHDKISVKNSNCAISK